MDTQFEEILDNCIADLRRGKNIEESLMNFPEHQSQLRPLLELARAIDSLPEPGLPPGAVSTTLVKIGQEVARQQMQVKGSIMRTIFQQPRLAWALSVSCILLLVSTGMTFIAHNSIPSDVLYPLKLATEKVRLLLTFDADNKAELRLRFSDQRLGELLKVFQQHGTVRKELLGTMLDEAKLSIEDANQLPVQEASLLRVKFNHVNAYQKEALEQIRTKVPASEREMVDKAIEVCSNRMQWMMRRMREGRNVPWGRGCDM